jgi:tetratricopeptide (TPR) repeat protein
MRAMQRVLTLMLVFLPLALSAQAAEPSWLLMERGEEAFIRGEMGDALRLFREVLERDATSPEPHYWIGRVFEEEGELDLAEIEYRRALEFRRQLYVLKYELIIRERLARLYKIRGDYSRFEQALLEIVAMNPEFDSSEGAARQTAVMRLLMNQGLEKVVELYRIDSSETFLAHAELGLFYYRTGRYRDSVMHLLYAGMTVISRTIEYQRIYRPFWEFGNLETLFLSARDDLENAAYLEETHTAALLYYLGAALYAAGDSNGHEELMTLVRDGFGGTPWRSRAISQLADPYIEPVITAEDFFYFF